MLPILLMFSDVLKELRFSYATRRIIRVLSSAVTKKRAKGNIVIGNIRGSRFFLLADCILAYLFSRMGYKVFILLDDGLLTHNDNFKALEYYNGNTKLKLEEFICQAFIRNKTHPLRVKKKGILSRIPVLRRYSSVRYALRQWIDKSPDIRVVLFSSIVSKEQDFDALLEKEYQALSRGKLSVHVDASHRRCFGGRPFNRGNAYHLAYARGSIRNEWVMTRVAEHVLRELEPTLYVSLDGSYSVYGPMRDTMKKHGVPVMIYRPDGFRDRTIYIGEMPYGVYNISAHWEYFVNRVYDSGFREKGQEFLESRVGLTDYTPNEFDRKWVEHIRQHRKEGQKVIVLFPNLSWDGAIKERDVVFDGLDDWLFKTIQWCENKNILVVVREHPQPLNVYSRFESCLALLTELDPHIVKRPNVMFIKGTEYVNSYYLVSQIADCTATYGGTLSLEISYMGYPIVIAANSPYSKKSVAFEPKTQDEYFNSLLRIDRQCEAFRLSRETFKENAIKAAAYQFFYNLYSFPVMPKHADWVESKYTAAKYWQSWDFDSLDPLKNEEFRRTIERFLFPVLNPAS